MKKIFYFLFATVLCGGFTACEGLNDDAENENGNENEELSYEELIIGVWELYKEYSIDEKEWDYMDEEDYWHYYKFNADGTGYWREEYYEESYGWEIEQIDIEEWFISNNVLIIRSRIFDEDGEVVRPIIKDLTSDQLVLTEYYEDSGNPEGFSGYDMYYRRIQ